MISCILLDQAEDGLFDDFEEEAENALTQGRGFLQRHSSGKYSKQASTLVLVIVID